MDDILKIEADTFESAYRNFCLRFESYNSNSTDQEIYKETPAIISVFTPKSNPINFNGTKFLLNKKNELLANQDINDLVITHYQNLLENGTKIQWLIEYLKANTYSKRAILNFWDEKHSDLSVTCPCLIYFWFRIYDGRLCLISHLRANDVYNKMLLNMYLFSSVQAYMSQMLDLKIGTYHHYVDSAHVYNKDREKYIHLLTKLQMD